MSNTAITDNHVTDTGASVSEKLPSSESLIQASTKDDRYIDDSGYHIGQTMEHDGFTIEACLDNSGETARLLYVATENGVSQKTHARQFRYTRVFETLDEAQVEIDKAQDGYAIKTSNEEPSRKISNGYTSEQMEAKGWTRVAAG